MAGDIAAIKSDMVPAEKKWHEAVIGRGGTTLNASVVCLSNSLLNLNEYLCFRIIGEDKTLYIKFGADAGDPSTEDVILVRGIRNDVDRAVSEIRKIIQDAKNDEIVNSHVSSHFSP